MPIRAARRALTRASASRPGQAVALAALALLLAGQSLRTAIADGETRTISFHHMHTGEDLTVTYMRNGQYDPDALKKIDHELRDWRRNEEIHIDPRLIDAVWQAYRDVGAKGPVQVVCGYRSPSTNAMLRSRSRGVAQFSQHMLGKAMDFYIPGVPLEKLREAGLRLQRGGVGFYPTSGSPFVHMDVGNVRHWPRMTREQLARVFPDGRTVHIPTDGRPLPGYALALADIERRKSSQPSANSLDAARTAGIDTPARPQRNLFAALLGSKDEDEDNETAAQPASPPPAVTPQDAKRDEKAAKAKSPRVATPQPAPRAVAKSAPAPAAAPSFQLASAASAPTRLGASPTRDRDNMVGSANDVIANRGMWPDPAPTPAAQPERRPAETTGAVATPAQTPWPMRVADAADQASSALALAYAAQTKAEPRTALTRGLAPSPAVSGAATTMPQPRMAAAAAPGEAPASVPTVKIGATFNDPWLRALLLAPNLQHFMTATVLGLPDMRSLRPLMEKPDAVVTMSFGNEPYPGLSADHFGGNAVVFVPTTTFAKRSLAQQ